MTRRITSVQAAVDKRRAKLLLSFRVRTLLLTPRGLARFAQRVLRSNATSYVTTTEHEPRFEPWKVRRETDSQPRPRSPAAKSRRLRACTRAFADAATRRMLCTADQACQRATRATALRRIGPRASSLSARVAIAAQAWPPRATAMDRESTESVGPRRQRPIAGRKPAAHPVCERERMFSAISQRTRRARLEAALLFRGQRQLLAGEALAHRVAAQLAGCAPLGTDAGQMHDNRVQQAL